jgi:5-methylcytosine-specific restriction endonuclease McrBC GTP-binding regulatory subunit McrB
VILSGISGTGKTQLCTLYANAVYGLGYEYENPYLKIIPVRPDWTDSTSLIGYYSSFEKRYMMEDFLETILKAQKERDKPHFVVLDEMNLARVEYYLSDYLSTVESKKKIRLHSQEDIPEIPQEMEIPPNLYVIGTINVDETTHSISDKVLDRAFVMMLSDVDFTSYWNAKETKFRNSLSNEFKLLVEVHSKLADYDLHFGYRTMDEMLQKLYSNIQLSEDIQMNRVAAIDSVISEKVLPKLRGDERITELINDLAEWTEKNFGSSAKSLMHLIISHMYTQIIEKWQRTALIL